VRRQISGPQQDGGKAGTLDGGRCTGATVTEQRTAALIEVGPAVHADPKPNHPALPHGTRWSAHRSQPAEALHGGGGLCHGSIVSRLHGRALANIGLKDWAAALTDIDAAIETHQKGFGHRPGSPCEGMLAMQRARALILEKLGREEEARAARQAAAIQPAPCPMTPYEIFHQKLGKLPIVPN